MSRRPRAWAPPVVVAPDPKIATPTTWAEFREWVRNRILAMATPAGRRALQVRPTEEVDAFVDHDALDFVLVLRGIRASAEAKGHLMFKCCYALGAAGLIVLKDREATLTDAGRAVLDDYERRHGGAR